MLIRSEKYISQPVVACSIIVFNQKDYIGQCLDGILSQECDFQYNIVVADDCSTDGTQDILREYQDRYPDKIKLVLNERNGHIAANWVSCCKELEGGEFIAFCDGDDYWSNPNKLQLQVDYLRQHPECVALSTNNVKLLDDGSREFENKTPLTGWVQEDMWTKGSAMAHWSSFMMRKDIFDKHIPLDGFVENNFPFQDWPTMVIMAGYGEFHYLPVVTTTYRIVRESDSHGTDMEKIAIRQEKSRSMNKYLASLFPNLKQDSDEEFDKYIALTMISACIINDDFDNAKRYAKNSCKKNLRYWCCQTKFTFKIFRMAKFFKTRLYRLGVKDCREMLKSS